MRCLCCRAGCDSPVALIVLSCLPTPPTPLSLLLNALSSRCLPAPQAHSTLPWKRVPARCKQLCRPPVTTRAACCCRVQAVAMREVPRRVLLLAVL